MPRPAGTTEVGDRRRSEILRKAEELLVAGTFREMTMDAIADSIGVGKSTLYHYFPKKDGILFELMSQTLTQLISSYRSRLETSMPHSSRLHECMCDVMELTAEAPGRARALYEQKRTLNWEQQARLDELEREYFGLIADSVRGAVATGELQDIDPTMATHAVTAMVAHSRHWYTVGGRYTPREVADFFWQLFMNGARSRVTEGVRG